jgi:hypothetical protein
MRKFILIIIFTIMVFDIFAQSKTEVGLSAGPSFYFGDINTTRSYMNPSFDAGLIYKYNLTKRYVLRANINYINLEASDAQSIDQYELYRQASFNTYLIEAALLFEFNFLNFKFSDRYLCFSPYINTGLVSFYCPNTSVQPAIPFSVGVKQTISNRLCFGVEWCGRMTFTDKLDNLPVSGDGNIKTYLNNNDWYATLTLTLTVRIFSDVNDCPTYKDCRK